MTPAFNSSGSCIGESDKKQCKRQLNDILLSSATYDYKQYEEEVGNFPSKEFKYFPQERETKLQVLLDIFDNTLPSLQGAAGDERVLILFTNFERIVLSYIVHTSEHRVIVRQYPNVQVKLTLLVRTLKVLSLQIRWAILDTNRRVNLEPRACPVPNRQETTFIYGSYEEMRICQKGFRRGRIKKILDKLLPVCPEASG